MGARLVILLPLSFLLCVTGALARAHRAEPPPVPSRGAPPLDRLKSPRLSYDIAVLPPVVPENYRQAQQLQERLSKLLAQKGLRVVPLEQVDRTLKLLHGGRISDFQPTDFDALSSRLRCRYFFLFKLAHLRARKAVGLGQYAMILGRVLLGGLLLGLRSPPGGSGSMPWGVVGGIAAGGAFAVGVTVSAEAGFQGRIYDALNQKTLWKGTGGAKNSKELLALFASKDALSRRTVREALGSLLNPPPDLFPVDPWASLNAPNSEEEVARIMQHTIHGQSAWDSVPASLKGKFK
jgi:hypothetical protein